MYEESMVSGSQKDMLRPNEEERSEQRRKYTQQAVDEVLVSNKKGNLAKNGYDFVLAVQKELLEKSALQNQIPAASRETFEAEYSLLVTNEIVSKYLGAKSSDPADIYEAIQRHYRA